MKSKIKVALVALGLAFTIAACNSPKSESAESADSVSTAPAPEPTVESADSTSAQEVVVTDSVSAQ